VIIILVQTLSFSDIIKIIPAIGASNKKILNSPSLTSTRAQNFVDIAFTASHGRPGKADTSGQT